MSIFNRDQTSKRVASEASSILRNKRASKMAKSVAGSALVQAPHKEKPTGVLAAAAKRNSK